MIKPSPPNYYLVPDGSLVKNLPAKARSVRDLVQSPGGEYTLEKEMATHSSIIA